MLVLLFVASWFILRGDLFYILPCVVLFLYSCVFTRLAFYPLVCVCVVGGGGGC